MRDEATRFPITLWPEAMVEPSPVLRGSVKTHPDGSLRWYLGDEAPVLLASELVLRELLEVDVAHDEALIDFCLQHGVLALRFSLLTTFMTGALDDDGRGYGGLKAGRGCTHLDDLRLWILTAQAMVHHWLAYLDGASVEEAWDQPHPIFIRVANPWQAFAESLTAGLKPYRVRVSYWSPDIDQPPELIPDLFSGLCLQLFNLVVENLPVHSCANETCGRRFVRQRGGAEAGQYRTIGVRFCSPSCARAQAQREYRRRQGLNRVAR